MGFISSMNGRYDNYGRAIVNENAYKVDAALDKYFAENAVKQELQIDTEQYISWRELSKEPRYINILGIGQENLEETRNKTK